MIGNILISLVSFSTDIEQAKTAVVWITFSRNTEQTITARVKKIVALLQNKSSYWKKELILLVVYKERHVPIKSMLQVSFSTDTERAKTAVVQIAFSTDTE